MEQTKVGLAVKRRIYSFPMLIIQAHKDEEESMD